MFTVTDIVMVMMMVMVIVMYIYTFVKTLELIDKILGL